jgi:hypothetical protein
MKFGILLWFDRRNTFSASAVVDSRFAIAVKAGATFSVRAVFNSIEWHSLHQASAKRRPDEASPLESCVKTGPAAARDGKNASAVGNRVTIKTMRIQRTRHMVISFLGRCRLIPVLGLEKQA